MGVSFNGLANGLSFHVSLGRDFERERENEGDDDLDSRHVYLPATYTRVWVVRR